MRSSKGNDVVALRGRDPIDRVVKYADDGGVAALQYAHDAALRRPSALGGSTSTSTWSPCMAPLISLGGMKISSCRSGRLRRLRRIGPHKAIAVAMQIEAAGGEIVARAALGGSGLGNAPVLAVELAELAAHGEAGQLLQEQTPLASAAERQFADQLLVSGLPPAERGNPRHSSRSVIGQD